MNNRNSNHKLSIPKIQLIVVLLLLLFNPKAVYAQDFYKIFPTQQNISTDKLWTVKFSQEIDPVSVNDNNIKVQDESGNSLKINLNCSGSVVTIKSVNDYIPGKTYTILINNIKSTKGYTLKLPEKMNFITKNDVQVSQNIGQGSFVLTDTHTYKITDTLTVTAQEDTNFNLTCNVGTLSNSPYQKELDFQVSGPNAKIISEDSIHKQLSADSHVAPGDKVQYQIVRTVQNNGIKYIKDLSKTSGDYSNFNDYKKYTSPSSNIESDNQLITDKSKELFNTITNPYYKAKKAYEFVNTYMNYDTNNGNKGALNALNTGAGVCEDYAELYTALLRASGVPSRVSTGFWIDNSEFKSSSTVTDSKDRHAWVEYYLPEYGWIPAEPTNIYYYNGTRTLDYSFFSNLNSSGHIIEGYDSAGNNKDNNITYSYSQGSGLHIDMQTVIEKLN
jgi:Transglutaminase-like enzymes, putative cysteine proteases